MNTVLSQTSLLESAGTKKRAGITLIEVLVAIFIMGVGLLPLLTLFPLGAISMARAIKDDRAANIAEEAVAFGQIGEDVLRQTRVFVAVSLNNGSADPKTVLELRIKYQGLLMQAAGLESRLQELRKSITNPKHQRKLEFLLAQIWSIKQGLHTMLQLVLVLEQGGVDETPQA